MAKENICTPRRKGGGMYRALLFILLVSVAAGAPALSMAADDAATVELTKEERAWLQAHPKIRLGIMDAWPPMNFVDEHGSPRGLGVDWAAALNKRLGGRLVLEPAPFKEKLYATH